MPHTLFENELVAARVRYPYGHIDAISLRAPAFHKATDMQAFASKGSGHDTLRELLMEATAAFETDRLRAKLCIQQATVLLQSNPNPDARRQVELLIARGGLTSWQTRRLAAYIESNICSKISAVDLAALVQLSTGHFFRAFKVSFGATPRAYVTRQRMLRAQAIMANSEAPLSRIALDCGMFDQAHFSRTFRRVIGVSPNVWRRQFYAPGSITRGTANDR